MIREFYFIDSLLNGFIHMKILYKQKIQDRTRVTIVCLHKGIHTHDHDCIAFENH